MSVFSRFLPSILGPSTADGEEMAAHLDRWIGLKRRARQNVQEAANLIGDLADFNGPVAADVVSRARAAELQCNETWDQVKAHDEEILGLAQEAVSRGLISQAVVDDYRRRLDDAAGGLSGVFSPLGLAIIIVATALGIAGILIAYKLTDGAITRANDTNAVNIRGARLAQDWQIKHADQTGQAPDISTSVDTKGSPLVSIGVGAGGVGLLLAAVGGLLLLNSRGRRT